MTNSEIVKQIYKKAQQNGYRGFSEIDDAINAPILVYYDQNHCFYGQYKIRITKWFDIYGIIFSHDFAKAFWGIKWVCYFCGSERINSFGDEQDSSHVCMNCGKEIKAYIDEHFNYLESWQYHLQQMILEKEPLKYLEKFL